MKTIKTIIIGFMGTTHYETLDYGDYNKQCFSTCAIFEKYTQNGTKIDKVISLGTTEAKMNSMNLCNNLNLIKNKDDNIIETMEKVMEKKNSDFPKWSKTEIPESCKDFFEYVNVKSIENETELNETFHQILDIVKTFADQHKKDEIKLVIDVTNGFRTQPIAAIMIANLIKQKFKNVKVDDLWYGIKIDIVKDTDKTNKYNKGLLLSIKKQNELADWSLGLHNYIQTGDTETLKLIMQNGKNKSEAEKLVNQLEFFSQCLKVCRMDDVKKAYENVNKAILDFEEVNKTNEFSLLSSMFDEIKNKFKPFEQKLFKSSIDWNCNHGNIQQAITMCNEYLPVFVYQHNLLYETGYDIHKPEKFKIDDKKMSDYEEIKNCIRNKNNLNKYFREAERVNTTNQKVKACLDNLISIIEKDIRGVLQNETDNTCLTSFEKIKKFENILFSDDIKDEKIKKHLDTLWNKHKEFHNASFLAEKTLEKNKMGGNFDKKLIAKICFQQFTYIYSLCVVDDLIYCDNALISQIKDIFSIKETLGTDNTDLNRTTCLYLHKLYEYKYHKNIVTLNEKETADIKKYEERHHDALEQIIEKVACFVNKVYQPYRSDYILANKSQAECAKIIREKNNRKQKSLPLSNRLAELHISESEFTNVVSAYIKIRQYRNDINHAGLSFANKMEDHRGKTRTVEDFYNNSEKIGDNRLINSLKIVSNFIGKIEEQDRD
ncbi:MAG: TM1812 family CRISPR-associated protein [Longicatena sp.]